MFGKKGYEPLKSRVLFPLLLLAIVPGLARANNLPPLASFTDDVNRDFFFAGESVTFDGSASIDQDEGGAYINYYRWRVDGVIVHQGSSASQYTTSFSLSVGQSSKTVQVSLEVRDDENTWTTSEGRMTKTYTIRRGQDRHFYLKDHLGSVRVTVDEEGEPLGFDDYYPYGLQMPTRSSNTSNPNDRYKFTGHERDTEAGLTFDYMGARTYDPLLGIFMQIDPLMEFSTPYSYVGGNPVNLTDPTGMSSECANRGHRGIEDLEAYLVECGSQTALTHKTDPRKELTREKDKGENEQSKSQEKPQKKNFHDLADEGDQAVIDHVLSYLFYLRDNNLEEGDLSEIFDFYRPGSFFKPEKNGAPASSKGGFLSYEGSLFGENIRVMFQFRNELALDSKYTNVDLSISEAPKRGAPQYGGGFAYQIELFSKSLSKHNYTTITIVSYRAEMQLYLTEKILGHISN